MEEEWTGKNVLVTGGTSGIGKEVVKKLHKSGATVIIIGRSLEKLKLLEKELQERVFIQSFDLKELQKIEEIFKFCKARQLKLDAFVHAAGIGTIMPLKMIETDIMVEIMHVNCLSFIELGKYFARKSYSNDGSAILAVSSDSTQTLPRGNLAYAVSKAGLETAVKIMAKELIKRKIRVNAILPGYVNTPMYTEEYIENFLGGIQQIQPLGLIQPYDVACLIEFLISERAKYITGSCIPITAGLKNIEE